MINILAGSYIPCRVVYSIIVCNMVKVCAVPGCQTGRYKDRTDRHALGMRQLAVFRTPKCNNRLDVWKQALGCDLDVKKFICELHFDEEYIKKYDKTVLPNGKVHKIPRIIWHLTHDAIPKPRSQICPNIGSVNEAVQDNSQVSTTERPSHHGHNASDNTVLSVCPSTLSMESVSTNSPVGMIVFTMDMLQVELNTALLPESWAWTRQSSKTIFTLLDPSSLCPKLYLEVASDLALQLRTKTGVIIPLNENAKSMTDIRVYFDILQKMSICSGTGIDSESRHRNCAGILDADEIYKRNQRNPRCMLCRQLRLTMQKNRQQRHDSARQKYNQAKLMEKLTRRRFLRLQQRVPSSLTS